MAGVGAPMRLGLQLLLLLLPEARRAAGCCEVWCGKASRG